MYYPNYDRAKVSDGHGEGCGSNCPARHHYPEVACDYTTALKTERIQKFGLRPLHFTNSCVLELLVCYAFFLKVEELNFIRHGAFSSR
jgi:hypothetical protein